MGRPSVHTLLLFCDGGLYVLHQKLEAFQRADGATLTGRVLGSVGRATLLESLLVRQLSLVLIARGHAVIPSNLVALRLSDWN
jgi:hypothetical protein